MSSWLHCHDCHHEFHGYQGERCDWCGGDSYVLEMESNFARFIREFMLDPSGYLGRTGGRRCPRPCQGP